MDATGGQVLSAIVGCCMRLALGNVLWLSAPLGMSLALVVMMLTRTTHPPGNDTIFVQLTHTTLWCCGCLCSDRFAA